MLSYLNQGEYFILHDRRWVVFRRDDFNKHTINKVPAGDQSMKTMATVLHTRLQDLRDAENAGLGVVLIKVIFFSLRVKPHSEGDSSTSGGGVVLDKRRTKAMRLIILAPH